MIRNPSRPIEESRLSQPQHASIIVPPEWAVQRAIWTAWPANADEWAGDLESPRRDVAALIHTLARYDNHVRLLVNGAEADASARAMLGEAAEFIDARYGDIWLRDTGPIFARDSDTHLSGGGAIALRFRTNSWGGKFDLPDDATVGDVVAEKAGAEVRRFGFVLEGGAVDHDGNGTILTTRQTLLNPNRNGWTVEEAETALRQAMGARKVIWIDEGLSGDHTDGHIDNIARFVGPAHVVCQTPAGDEDPNAGILRAIADRLDRASDAEGNPLRITRVPGVGRYINNAGGVSPASHMNFIIANGVVVVPVYGTPNAEAALTALQDAFPSREVVGVSSRGLLGHGDAGGGSFHCITQQEPA